jgi:hypothetical protein
MRDQYLKYLQNKQIIKPSQRSFYIKWVTDLFRACNKEPGQDLSQAEIDAYLAKLMRTRAWGARAIPFKVFIARSVEVRSSSRQMWVG